LDKIRVKGYHFANYEKIKVEGLFPARIIDKDVLESSVDDIGIL